MDVRGSVEDLGQSGPRNDEQDVNGVPERRESDEQRPALNQIEDFEQVFDDPEGGQRLGEMLDEMAKELSGAESPENEKLLGNRHMKNGMDMKNGVSEFEKALERYQRAIELDPNNLSYINNKAAALVRLGKYGEAIAVCSDGLTRLTHAPHEHRSRAYLRMWAAYLRLMASPSPASPDDLKHLEQAEEFFEKSLLERNTSIVERELKMMQRLRKIKESAEVEFEPMEKGYSDAMLS